MTDLDTLKGKLTSPTAFSWYGVAGVVITGVLTFFSTKRWMSRCALREKVFNMYSPPYVRQTSENYYGAKRDEKAARKMKVKDALIFVPPVLAAVSTSYCILHGNAKALKTIGKLTEANNFLSVKFDKTKAAAVGAAANEVKNQYAKKENQNRSGKYLFSDDPNEVEDYGKAVWFYDTFTEEWFESTILDVLMAEEELHKFFALRGYASVAEFQVFCGSEPLQWTNQCGWDDEIGFKKGYLWVEFAHRRIIKDDGAVYYEIDYLINPIFAEEFEWITPELED